MELTLEDLSVIVEARDLFKERITKPWSERVTKPWSDMVYICSIILHVLLKREGVNVDEGISPVKLSAAGFDQYSRLTNAISSALDGNATLNLYVRGQPQLKDYESKFVVKWIAEARLAWLDRMIETNRIA